MNKLTDFIIYSLAVYRLTKLIKDDYITEDIRNKVLDKFPPQTTKIGYFFTCPWCISIWAAATLTLLGKVTPELEKEVSLILASSAVTGLISENGF